VLVAFGIRAVVAAKHATTTIPIVVPATTSDLVAMGLVASLARPGGNLTGSVMFGPETAAKLVELFKEAVPRLTRVAVLLNPANAASGLILQAMRATAEAVKLELQPFEVRAPKEFGRTFSAMAKEGVDAIVVSQDTLFGANAKAIADLAARQRLPRPEQGIRGSGRPHRQRGEQCRTVSARGLLCGPDTQRREAGRSAGRGPTRFELVINLKTAKALGITFPESILIRADRVIE
jgi:putative ABC transport system substrate-binding protein